MSKKWKAAFLITVVLGVIPGTINAVLGDWTQFWAHLSGVGSAFAVSLVFGINYQQLRKQWSNPEHSSELPKAK